MKKLVYSTLLFFLASTSIAIAASQSCFSDIPEDSWFTEYVCTAKENKLVNGYTDGSYKPSQEITRAEVATVLMRSINPSEKDITEIIEETAKDHQIPSWFLKSIVLRESTFNPNLINMDDGTEGDENWNEARAECSFTTDDHPHGLGLTQLTGWMYQGSPYPFCLTNPDKENDKYYWSMAKQNWGDWIKMEEVSHLDDPFDPQQNLERFLTGYAIPAFELFEPLYSESEEETWRRVAFHWNKGMYATYDPYNTSYLELYDKYVDLYKDDSTTKIAFIGDQGLSSRAEEVLQLIKNENADAVLHQGDFDYEDDPDAWEEMINENLGNEFPYFASIGNHDIEKWDEYQNILEDRLARSEGSCSGDYGINADCNFRDLFFILSGVGTQGENHEEFLEEELEKDSSDWQICSWHKNQKFMQAGGKGNEVGWEAYEICREAGAIVATGHEHMYSRTHLMSNFENQEIASTSNTLKLAPGKSFAFVSGIAGKSIREEDPELAANSWWANVYSETQNADHGALFCEFEDLKAYCYFKNINGKIIDEFNLESTKLQKS